ncbi:MAG TPA: hypothetical protein V6C63_21440 [Allocoleopsis sp.]
MNVNQMRLADAVVNAWAQKLPTSISPIDIAALRANVAQALQLVVSEKDREIAELRERLGIVHGTAREVLREGDRNA